MHTLLEKIQSNTFLTMTSKVIGMMDPIYLFISLTVIFTTLFTGGQPWTNPYIQTFAPSIIPIICGICVFVLSLSIGKMKSNEDISAQSLLIASGTVVSLIPILVQYAAAPYALFVAFWIAILQKFIYVFIRDLKFKLKGLPPAVSSTLNGLLPILAIALFSVGCLSLITQYGTPLVEGVHGLFTIMGSYPVILLSVLAVCLIWTAGYHGANTVNRVMRSFWVPMTLVNLVTFTTTGTPAFIGTEALITTFVWIGGSGGTLGLSIMIKLFAKSSKMRAIADESLVPGFFNINEPVIFGIPIVENKRYYIPFFLAPTLMVSLAYWAVKLGYVKFAAYTITWIMPGPLAAFIGSFFDWRAGLLTLGLILISGLVYLPFILQHDKALLDEERVLN